MAFLFFLVRFDLGAILNGFGQANNNNKQQQNNDPVASLLGGLLNQNIAVTLNDQGQIQVNGVDPNKNNNQQQQTTSFPQQTTTTTRPVVNINEIR